MRRKDRELFSKNEIVQIINESKAMQIAFVDGSEPYIVTLNFGYKWDSEKYPLFYFHSADQGRKIDCIKNNPRVCFSLSICDTLITGENACSYGMKFRSIVGYGMMSIVNDDQERIEGLNLLMHKYTGKRDWHYEDREIKRTLVSCLEVESLTGKKKG
jgi:nitroimidazol reductase NimA-like FMN-containing flavoprotein (pyridoxamine 5'-phosphate oxidase superfamily)